MHFEAYVLIGKYKEVVTLDIKERQEEVYGNGEKNQRNGRPKQRPEILTLPAILVYETTPLLEAITVERIASVAYVQKRVGEERLECRNGSALID